MVPSHAADLRPACCPARVPRATRATTSTCGSSRATGRCTDTNVFRWRNISANPTSELQFHLLERVAERGVHVAARSAALAATPTRPGRTRGDRPTSGFFASSPRPPRRTDAAPSFHFARTMAIRRIGRLRRCTLPRPVAPNETIEVEIDWSAKIPRPFRSHGLHRRLLLFRPVVSSSVCSKTPGGIRTSFTREPSSIPTTASTTSG